MSLERPSYKLKIKKEDGKVFVFDEIRKKYVVLTPEEHVRQNIIQFLIIEKSFPKNLFTVEGSIDLNGLKRRFDILISANTGNPIMIVECKAPNIKIDQTVFDQITAYNMVTKVEYLLVTNGINNYCCRLDFTNNCYEFLKDIPDYFSIIPKGSK